MVVGWATQQRATKEDHMIRAIRAVLSVALGVLVVAPPALGAQSAEWPTRPVRFIVPFPPGGSVDPLARLLGARLSSALGHQFIVDNRAGASGSIGAAAE